MPSFKSEPKLVMEDPTSTLICKGHDATVNIAGGGFFCFLLLLKVLNVPQLSPLSSFFCQDVWWYKMK
jgi:hypothetical protein